MFEQHQTILLIAMFFEVEATQQQKGGQTTTDIDMISVHRKISTADTRRHLSYDVNRCFKEIWGFKEDKRNLKLCRAWRPQNNFQFNKNIVLRGLTKFSGELYNMRR